MSNGGCLSSDSPQAGICIWEKLCHVGEGTRTELVVCVLLVCTDFGLWGPCAHTGRGTVLMAVCMRAGQERAPEELYSRGWVPRALTCLPVKS